MFGRIFLIAAAAVLIWILWIKLRKLILGLPTEKRKKVDAGAEGMKSVKLEKDSETGRYRPEKSDVENDPEVR